MMGPRIVMMMVMCVVRVWCSPLPSPNSPTQASPQPHIILIVADDLGWNDVSWHNPVALTPHLYNLAHGVGGVLLEQSYVQPICTPSRSALLAGRYPFTIGRQHSVLWPQEPTGLTLNATLLPQILKEAGYSTHIVGKWHLGFCSWDFTPTMRGFDSFYGFYTGAEDYYTHVRPLGSKHACLENQATVDDADGVTLGYDFRNNTTPDLDDSGTYSAYLFASYVENLLSSRSPQDPLFLYLPFQSVHAPLQVPEEYIRPYAHINNAQRRIKLGMVTAMDEAVGRVVAALRDTGHYNNSVIIFTTDNGGPTVAAGNNWPLRGNKTTLWEGGTRGAALVHSPLLQHTPRVSHQLVHVTDWFPTLAGLAGGAVPSDIDGVDQWGALTEETPPPRSHLVYNIDNTTEFSAGVRMGDYKLLVGNPGPGEWTPAPEDRNDTADLSVNSDQQFDPLLASVNPSSSSTVYIAQEAASSLKKAEESPLQEMLEGIRKSVKDSAQLQSKEMHHKSRSSRRGFFLSQESNSEFSSKSKPSGITSQGLSENSIHFGYTRSKLTDTQKDSHEHDEQDSHEHNEQDSHKHGEQISHEHDEITTGTASNESAFVSNMKERKNTLVQIKEERQTHVQPDANGFSEDDIQNQINKFWEETRKTEIVSNLERWQSYYKTVNLGSEELLNITSERKNAKPGFGDRCNETLIALEHMNTDVEQHENILKEIRAMEQEFVRRRKINIRELEDGKDNMLRKTNYGERTTASNVRPTGWDADARPQTKTEENANRRQKKKTEDKEDIEEMLEILGVKSSEIRLYNLAVDPEERDNLAESQPEEVKVLLHLLLTQLPRYVPADIRPDDPDSNPENYGNVWSPGWCHPQP